MKKPMEILQTEIELKDINPIEIFNARWKNWPYKNTLLLIVGIGLFIYFAESVVIQSFIAKIGALGYFGAFLAGIFFISAFTVVPAMAIIYYLADSINPVYVAIFAGIGAMVGDYLLFKYLKDRVFVELAPIFQKISGSFIGKLFRTPYFSWFIPLAGIFVIASPIPDEAGIGLLSLSRIKSWQFILICLMFNIFGILTMVILARVF